MIQEQRSYFCIDMKCFYASVECAERGLNPFETDLVVADVTRGTNALCLAISPRMKARGIRNRCRLSEIPNTVQYEIAPPRMQLYIEYAADIYGLYLDYFAPEDIHVYSIDECFIDATNYLAVYGLSPKEMAVRLMNEIAEKLHIPSTAGIGTNLYLAKIALDITAKHTKDHVGCLDEELYRETLWEHRPITDFWRVAGATARTLERNGMVTMKDVAMARPELLYKLFGVDAELLIDHAWGRESCLMEDIKNYKSRTKSLSFTQILPRDYSVEEARIVMAEMVLHGCHELMKRKVISQRIGIFVAYSGERRPTSQGYAKLTGATSVNSLMQPYVLALYDRIAEGDVPIRRLGISFENVCDEACEGYDFFTDREAVEKEKARERAVLSMAQKYGKNAVLRGTSFLPAATQRERNEMIGGHRAGYDETGKSKTVHGL